MNSVLNATRELPNIQVSDEFKHLSVLGLVADRSACGYYRVILPLHYLKMHGAKITTTSVQNMSDFTNHDLVIAPRQHSEDIHEALSMIVWPKHVLFEIDDDLSSVLPSSPAFYSYHNGSPELLTMSKIIQTCSGLTCTTPEIAKWYSQYNTNVSILENCIDFGCRDWGCDVSWSLGAPTIKQNPILKPEKWKDKIVVSYSGGSCFDDQTEILTDQGWKLFKDLDQTESVGTWNHELNKFEYQKPVSYTTQPYEGNLNCIVNDSINVCTTPNHWMYVSDSDIFGLIQSGNLTDTDFDCTVIKNHGDFDKINSTTKVFKSDHSSVEYNGMVYCVTVPNHLIVVRRYHCMPYVCGNTHSEDLLQIGPAIKKILEERNDVIFAMYTAEHTLTEIAGKFNWPMDKVDFIEPRHFMDHPAGLHGIDIGLAPIMPCQFNSAKSFLKNLEYMAAGAASIASNFGPYTRFERRHPGSILTVGNGGKWSQPTWYSAITKLLDDPQLLESMKSKGRQLVVDEYSLEHNFRLWPVAWKHLCDQADKGESGPPTTTRPQSDYKSYGSKGRNDLCYCGSKLKQKFCCGESI